MNAISRPAHQSVRRRYLCVALFATLLMAGCANAELSSDFNSDGSATHTVEVQVDRSVLTLAPPELASLNPEQIVQAARERGLEATEISTADRIGVRIWRDVEDSTDIGATFSDILASLTNQPPAGVDQIVSGSYTSADERYALDMTLNSDAVLSLIGGDGASNLPAQVGQLVDFTYLATFPAVVQETNGTKVGDNQVRWELPLTGETQLTAVAEGDAGGTSPLLFILLAVILLLAALAVGYLFLRRRTRPAPAVATSGTATDQAVIVTTGGSSDATTDEG